MFKAVLSNNGSNVIICWLFFLVLLCTQKLIDRNFLKIVIFNSFPSIQFLSIACPNFVRSSLNEWAWLSYHIANLLSTDFRDFFQSFWKTFVEVLRFVMILSASFDSLTIISHLQIFVNCFFEFFQKTFASIFVCFMVSAALVWQLAYNIISRHGSQRFFRTFLRFFRFFFILFLQRYI